MEREREEVRGGEHERARVGEGMEHLRAAALELIAAGRSFLDALETVVKDGRRMEAVTEKVADVVSGLADALREGGVDRGRGTRGSFSKEGGDFERITVEKVDAGGGPRPQPRDPRDPDTDSRRP